MISQFGVAFENVPLINLRWEFRDYFFRVHDRWFLHEPDFKPKPITTSYFVWVGMPDAGASMLVSRAVVGLESYICAAANFESAYRGSRSAQLQAACRNPFTLGKHAADNLFNRLPDLVATGLQMKTSSPAQWVNVSAFYKEVRNPLSHGRQFDSISQPKLSELFACIAEIYQWIDTWFDPEKILPGAARSFQLVPIPNAT